MAVPLAIYLAFKRGRLPSARLGSAMSTGTALLLGLISPLARGGTRLRVRLLTLALWADRVALVVIATAYSSRT